MMTARTIFCTLILAALATTAEAGELVEVQLNCGRTLVAQVDDRTDGDHLWLVSQGRVTTFVRPVAWGRIVTIRPVALPQYAPIVAKSIPSISAKEQLLTSILGATR
jgi:hypothetical protein